MNYEQPCVGIFFWVNGTPLIDMVVVEGAEPYGDTYGYSGHYDFWEALQPANSMEALFKSHPYDCFPRGRVVFFSAERQFKLYADKCVTKAEVEKIAKIFHLPAYQLARDSHYQCAKCNFQYVNI